MTSASSEQQNNRWGRRLRNPGLVEDDSSVEQTAQQCAEQGPSRRWRSCDLHTARQAEVLQAPALKQCERHRDESERSSQATQPHEVCAAQHVPTVDHGYQQYESKFGRQRMHQGQASHSKSHHTLALRAAQDAQASAARAGMLAKVEARDAGGVQTSVLGGEAFYLPEWFCNDQDRSIYDRLRRELHSYIAPFRGKSLGLAGTQAILEKCPVYKDIVTRLASHFQVEACYSIVNFYQDGSHGIGAHTDSLFFGSNMTIGASFGDPRELIFEHKRTGQRFQFPQRNGDIFAFTDVANRAFRHSVPKTKDKVGGRLSVIVWARQGGFKQVSLQNMVMPSEQDILEAAGDWNRAQQLAVTKLTSGDWKREH